MHYKNTNLVSTDDASDTDWPCFLEPINKDLMTMLQGLGLMHTKNANVVAGSKDNVQ
jgi:hypothetical protein